MNPSILLVESDNELANLLLSELKEEHFQVEFVQTVSNALKEIHNQSFDAIILDVKLPNGKGLEVLETLRKQDNTPVLMLTTPEDDITPFVNLDLGADDYLPKPCNPKELVSRLKAILRRSPKALVSEEITEHQGLQLDSAAKKISQHGQNLDLTTAEFNILEILLKAPGQAFSKEELTERALNRKYTVYDKIIDVHISNLRHKLGDHHDSEAFIKTVRGFGYLFIP